MVTTVLLCAKMCGYWGLRRDEKNLEKRRKPGAQLNNVNPEKMKMYGIIKKLWFGHKARHESTEGTLESQMELSTLLM